MFRSSLAITIFMVVIFASMLLLLSCSEEKKTTPTDTENPLPDPSIYYPHIAGSWWIYNDLSGNPAYKVKLCGPYDHPQAGDTQKLEIYTPDGSEGWSLFHVFYQKVTDTEVRIYQYTGSLYCLMLRMPLDVGDTWGYYYGEGDNVNCVSEESLSTPAGDFDTKQVEYTLNVTMKTWFAPGVGSFLGVKNIGWEALNFGHPMYTVVLADFHLEPF